MAIGSTCGTIKEVVDALRAEGKKVGVLKIRLFRPFPYQEVADALRNVGRVVVLDKNMSFGTKQVLASEVRHAIGRETESIVFGLGGRELFEKQVEEIFNGKEAKGFIM